MTNTSRLIASTTAPVKLNAIIGKLRKSGMAPKNLARYEREAAARRAEIKAISNGGEIVPARQNYDGSVSIGVGVNPA